MEFSPSVGLGDLLLLKMAEVSNNYEIARITLPLQIFYIFRLQPEKCLKFTFKLVTWLFPQTTVEVKQADHIQVDYNNYPINTIYIYDKVFPPHNTSNSYGDYIIFHTKIRIDGCMDDFKNTDLLKISTFLKDFRSNKKILLMGERVLEQNLEVVHHGIICIYDLLSGLKENNDVVDLTKEMLYGGNADFDDFLNDVSLINQAICNICLGIGGSTVLCSAFSKNNFIYISNYNLHWVNHFLRIRPDMMYRNIDQFLNGISAFLKT